MQPDTEKDMDQAHIHACGWVTVAQQEREDIVLAIMAGLGDQAQVRWVGAAISIAGCLLIGVWPGQRIAQPALPRVLLALIIGAVFHLSLQTQSSAQF